MVADFSLAARQILWCYARKPEDPMSKPRVVTIHYILTDDAGTVLDSSHESTPLQYLEGAGSIIPGLEKEISSLKSGDKKQVNVKAKEAYGEKRDDLVVQVPKTQFPPDVILKVGDRFRGGADHHSPIFTVMKI